MGWPRSWSHHHAVVGGSHQVIGFLINAAVLPMVKRLGGLEVEHQLRFRPRAPAACSGRLQRQIRRAFLAADGEPLSSSRIYDWC
jgi:hypothetical protein